MTACDLRAPLIYCDVASKNLSLGGGNEREEHVTLLEGVLPFLDHCATADFSDEVRETLREESRKLRRTRSVVYCMFPQCRCMEPYDVLELHHIHPRRFSGPGEPSNAILFCKNHHDWADRLIISAEDCLALKRGVDPYERFANESIDDLVAELQTLSEFSRDAHSMAGIDRHRRLSRILVGANNRPGDERILRAIVCAWAASEMACLMTAHIPGWNGIGPRRSHPRAIIARLASESNRFNEHAEDKFLTLRNLHVEAVNENALSRLESSAKKMRSLYETYASSEEEPPSFFKVDHRSYRAYLIRQRVSVLAKLGKRECVELAEEARKRVEKLRGTIPQDEIEETYARYLFAAMVAGGKRKTRKVAERVISGLSDCHGIKKVIALKVLALWSLCRGDEDDASYLTFQAKKIAIENDLQHQLHQVALMERAVAEGPKAFRTIAGSFLGPAGLAMANSLNEKKG